VDATGRLFRNYKQERRSDNPEREDASEPDSDSNSDSDSDSHTDSEASSVFDTTLEGDSKSPSGSKAVLVDKKSRGQPLLGLEYLVSSLSIFDTTDPHDTIYALLAIAKD